MPDYKAMYLSLFNSVPDAIEILTEAQKKTEEMYINSCENDEISENSDGIRDSSHIKICSE